MRSSHAIPFLLILFIAAFSPGAFAMQVHEDADYGYRITPPTDWPATKRAIRSDWIIAKFVSKDSTYYNDPEGWTWDFKPEMTIVALVHEVLKDKGVKKTTTITLSNPYKDYKDFLQKTYYGGGYYFSEEKESSVKDVPVTCYEAKVEKLARTGPKRIIAWVFHLKDLDIAVQFEILEKSYPKLRGDILRSLHSFRAIERTGELPVESGSGIISRVGWDKLDPVERARRLVELETRDHEKAVENLPRGWKHFKVNGILVLDNYNPRLAKEIARQCEAVLKWLEKNLDYIGPGEYVRAPIIRVFKTDDPDSAVFISGGSDNIVINYEHNPGWAGEMNFESVNRRALEIWLQDRDRDLYWAMPYWVRSGLEDLIENSRAKGSGLEFPRDVHDKVRLNQALNRETISSPRELMWMGYEQLMSGRWRYDEASALVRFFLIGPGSKNRKTRDLFRQYLENLAAVKAEIKKEEEANRTDKKPTTEEEEDAYFKQQQNAWKDKEKRVLEETFNRTFAGWTDKDWSILESAYQRMIDD